VINGTYMYSFMACLTIIRYMQEDYILFYLAVITGSNAHNAKRQYLNYSEGKFEVFHPTG